MNDSSLHSHYPDTVFEVWQTWSWGGGVILALTATKAL